MQQLIKKETKKKGQLVASQGEDEDSASPLADLNWWFASKPLDCSACPNVIAWWSVSSIVHYLVEMSLISLQVNKTEYLVLRMIAQDYLGIPGTTCIAKHSFLFSKRINSHQQRHMKSVKFGGLQKLCTGYTDGRLMADSEAIQKYAGDYNFESDNGFSDSEVD